MNDHKPTKKWRNERVPSQVEQLGTAAGTLAGTVIAFFRDIEALQDEMARLRERVSTLESKLTAGEEK